MSLARIYDDDLSLRESLLNDIEQHPQLRGPNAKHSRTIKNVTFLVGIMAGCLLQCWSMAFNYFITNVLHKSEEEIVPFSLLWSLFYAILTVAIVSFIRYLVSTTYEVSERDTAMEKLNSDMESRFAVGALVGVCSAWAVTGFFLGLNAHMILSVLLFLLWFVWYAILTSSVDVPSSMRQEEGRPDESFIIV